MKLLILVESYFIDDADHGRRRSRRTKVSSSYRWDRDEIKWPMCESKFFEGWGGVRCGRAGSSIIQLHSLLSILQ